MNQPASNINGNFLSDLTDGREKGDWESRYEEKASKEIKKERNYLLILLFTSILLAIISGLFFKDCLFVVECKLSGLKPYVFGALGGLTGGTIFSMKWLVHSVAKSSWSIDRQLWRTMTPFLSATIALLIIILINANMFNSNTGVSYSAFKSFGIGFLAGYFSDNAIGKLTEIAQVMFGSSSKKG